MQFDRSRDGRPTSLRHGDAAFETLSICSWSHACVFPVPSASGRGGSSLSFRVFQPMGRDSKQAPKGKNNQNNNTQQNEQNAKGVAAMECRHILVEKQSKALELVEKIHTGKISFNECARENSIDKAGRSGLLGWKRRDELDPIFWNAALTCKEGDWLREPVKTQWGWHIIMVQGRK